MELYLHSPESHRCVSLCPRTISALDAVGWLASNPGHIYSFYNFLGSYIAVKISGVATCMFYLALGGEIITMAAPTEMANI
jgi:hypothetical protein